MNVPNQRIVYLNGEFVPESEAKIPFRDRGVKFGDAVFDTTRTFGHDIFRLREHLERFYRSLKYLRINPGMTIDEFISVTEQVVARNLPLIGKDEDYWVTQRVTRGIDPGDPDPLAGMDGPTVIVECLPLPLAARAASYRDGLDVVTPSVRRVAPDMVSPRAKTHNYLNLILGELEVSAQDPNALAILLDENGNLSEGKGTQYFPGCRWCYSHAKGTLCPAGCFTCCRAGTRGQPRDGYWRKRISTSLTPITRRSVLSRQPVSVFVRCEASTATYIRPTVRVR